MTRRNRQIVRSICKKADQRYGRPDRLAARVRLADSIRRLEEEGLVAIVHGGIDCDGTRVDNQVSFVRATVTHVEAWQAEQHELAEGPHWSRIERPSDAARLVPSTRDLALEAFEDGHPHLLRMGA